MKQSYILLIQCLVVLTFSVSLTAQNEFITTWKTDNPGASSPTEITIPTTGGGYNYDVDWDNDGTFDQFGITSDVTHDFGTAGTYTVAIRGDFPRIYFNNGGDKDKILEVNQWGDIEWTSMEKAFWGCSNLEFNTYLPLDAPNLSNVTDMFYMLGNATSFNSPIDHWDVSNVEKMVSTFEGTTNFNQSLNNWDVSNVQFLNGLFRNATSFNQNLDGWNSKLSNVTQMYNMFNGATSFNGDISGWIISPTNMYGMFHNASSFNQDISGWDVSNASSLWLLFTNASSFNQDISGWDVSNVTNMLVMFSGATNFDQDLSSWDVSNVTEMTGMFRYVTLSTSNYENILIGWDTHGLQNGVNFHGGYSQYCSIAATNARANMIASDSWTITDGGLEVPTAICIATPFTLNLDATGNATLDPNDIDNGSTICGTGTMGLSLTQTAFDCSDIGTPITVNLFVDDGNGNTGTCTATVNVVDNIAPVPDVATLTDLTAECEVTSLTTPIATDNCGGTVTVTSDAILPITTQGTTVITWTYTDVSGNASTQTQNVIITDNTAPIPDVTTLANVTAECEVTSLTAPTATDNCSGTVTVTNDATLPITTQGTTIVTWTYYDSNGNTATQTQNVVITDTTAPIADVVTLADVTTECEVTSLTAPTATDNCGGTVTVTNDATLPITTQGTTIVTWTYYDSNGNTATQTQNVVITDTTAPIADVVTLADVTAECEVTSLTTPTATDNCDGTVTVTNDATLPITTQGTTLVTWTYDDGNGNTSTQTQNVVITDTTAPIADVVTLADVTAECEVTSLTTPTATDNCGGTVTVTNDATLPITAQGTTLVTWTYDDGNGNTSTQTQNVVITDITAPVPGVATLADVTDQCEVTLLTAPTATDYCGGTVTVTNDATLPITVQGTTLVTWTYDDGNGNTSTQTQNVVITDITAPVPGVATLADVTDQCEVTLLTAPTATDYCGGTVTVTNDATLPITVQGTTLVTWTYDDGNGNTSTQTQNVVITDITAPVPDVATLADVEAQCEVTSLTAPTATDNCGGIVTVTNDAILPITAQGTTVVTWSYEDAAGNISTQTQNVVITDNTAPVPDVATLANVTDQCEVTSLTNPTATDNCGGIVTVTNDAILPITAQGTTVVTWSYEDAAGNVSTQTQNVVITDNTAPVPDVATLANVTDQCEVTSLTDPTATDNCSGLITVTNDATLPITAQGTTVVTWTYTDAAGNASTQTQNVIITDTIAPVIAAAPSNITVECVDDVPAMINLPWTDNCDTGGTVAGVDSALAGDACGGTITRTWNYTDSSGNAAITRTQTITIDDTIAPVITVAPSDITVSCFSDVPDMISLAWTDNCDAGGTVTGIDSALVGNSYNGTVTRTWNIADACGNNATTRTQTITILDNTDPTFTFCPTNFSITNDSGNCSAVVNYTIPTATDNCGGATVVQTDATGLNSGDAFPVGDTTIEYTATDLNGNSSVCSFTITVIDSEAPTIVCLADISVNADTNCEITTIPLTPPTTNDNCAVATVTNNLAEQLPLPVGNHTVIWTVTDTAGLTTTCEQGISVVDSTPPVITCPTVAPYYTTEPGQCDTSLSFVATATDNCNGSPLINYEIGGHPITFPYTFSIGTTNVVAIADDGNGLTSTCNFDVIVEDRESPTAICQPLTIALDASGNASIAEDAINNGSSDACGGVTFDTDITDFDCSDIGANTVILTVTDASGNTDTCTTTVTVLDHVQGATASITSSPVSPICLGESVTFTATGTDLGASPQYEWFVAGSSVGNNSATYTTTSLANGDDIYVEISSGPCDTVTTSNTIIMTVNPLRPVTYTLNASENPVCDGENVTFFVSSLVNGGTMPSYQWYVNGSPVGSDTNSYDNATLVDGDIVSVEVSSNLTCADPVPATESLTMDIKPLPVVTALANGNSTNIDICEGDNLILTGSGATTYTWDSGVTNNVAFVPAVGTHTYTVTGTTNSCESTDTITVTVEPNPVITLTSTSADQSVCRTGGNPIGRVENIDFNVTNATSVTVTGLPLGVNYNYNAGLGRVRINGNPDNSISGTYNYTVTATNACSTTTATGEITVYYGTPSTPGTINGTSSFLCPVSTAIYYVEDDPNVETYNWTVPGSMTITNGQGTSQIEVAISGAFAFWQTISVTATNACGTSDASDKFVLLNFSSSIDIDAGNDIYVCEGTGIVTMNGDSDGLPNTEWEWSDNGAGGTFSTIGVDTPSRYCDGFLFFGYCVGDWIYPPPRPLYSETATYTLPSGLVAGDIITISLLADSGSFIGSCPTIEDTMRIHIIANPTAEMAVPSTICYGEDIVVNGTPNTTVSYTFNGSPEGTFDIGNSGTFSLPNEPAGTYEFTSVQYTDPPNSNGVGCVNLLSGETVTINATPTVTAPSDITICEGDTVNLASASIGGTNAIGTWSTTGNGSFSGSIYTPGALDILNGTVTLTYTNTPSDGICDAVSDSMVVTINELPTVNAGVNQTICADGSVTLSGVIGGSASSATWSAPDGSFSDSTDLNATYTPSITSGTVTLTLTTNDPSGPCGSTTDTIVITVNPAAIVDAGLDFTVCSTDSIVLNGTLSGSATNGTWSSSTGGTFGSASALNTTYTPSATDISNGIVTLTLTSNIPSGVCNAAIDEITITINEAATVNAGPNETLCSTETLDLSAATFGGSATSATWSSSGTAGTITGNIYTPSATDITNGSVILTYTTNNPGTTCGEVIDTKVVTISTSVNATASNTTDIDNCSNTSIVLSANRTGTWSAISTPSGRPYSFSNISDPNATFTGESGATYDITWTMNNVAPCAVNSTTFEVTFPECEDLINFDGSDDSVNLGSNYNAPANFSLEVWIKPNTINGSIQTILSKRDATNFATGYDLRLVNNTISFRANGSGLSANGITADRWYHIAVTFNGTTYTLYIDGVQRNSINGPSPAANTFNMLLGAMSRPGNTPTNYYNGWLDEIRLWNTTLTTTQIRDMMNQEIEEHGTSVRGSIVPLDISGLAWSNLIAYYQMNQSSLHMDAGSLIANKGVNGILRNMTTLQDESAPLPYFTSGGSTNWDNQDAWQNGTDLMIPNTNGVNWNIVSTQHNVTSNRPTQVLGLRVDNNTLTINNDYPITVNKYLKIDGTLDLEGESQLLQPTGSIVDYSGTGKLERDQQGSGNKFNYNYWGSPVSNAGISENRTYELAEVLYDGTNPVSWTTAYDAPGTSPATISSRWLYTYTNLTGAYADWNRINQNTGISVGLGYTMKGSGIGSSEQNYTFSGQPNNGTITHAISADNETLLSNPYPSAIDANAFISDNETALLDGKIIFWEQAPNNPSHNLAAYRGRYSYLNNTGGLASASAPIEIFDAGNALKIPGRYVPVGQGFFVQADADGGTLVFNNAQRVFKKEGSQSTFLRPSNNYQDTVSIPNGEESVIRRLRLNFTTPEGAVRHLLLGFTSDNTATDDVDYGYDALNADYFPSDLSFLIEGERYVIQGVGEFDDTKEYPLDMVIAENGNVEIGLTELENFDEAIDVYIFDAVEGTYTRFNEVNFQINIDAGTYSDRFYLVFQEDAVLSTIEEEFKDITVRYLHDTDEIFVKTPPSVEVKQLYLINVAGQTVASWNATNLPMSNEIKIPVKHISEGTYILKAETNSSVFNKKIIIKY
ncbi:BspA family leucine-rich repeat surface protein [Winogradskyella sp. SM1960]|uniref:HYR-like domain-containing protein n=1 Tax=Winogradskyella sp. SM1960 TaxID=2865955 RepID=UPI001CD70B57|nr:BspA family leucine-rich repeat surface protein [Winogradskyella sp. SM1960]